MTAPHNQSQPVCESDELRAVLGAFYKTVDVMKSARNQKKPMEVWADDMKAVEDVMFFLEKLRDTPVIPVAKTASVMTDSRGPDDCAEHMLLQAREKGQTAWTNIYAAQLGMFFHYDYEVRAIPQSDVQSPSDGLRAAAERVCWFDWSDNDMDAVAAVDALRKALALPSADPS